MTWFEVCAFRLHLVPEKTEIIFDTQSSLAREKKLVRSLTVLIPLNNYPLPNAFLSSPLLLSVCGLESHFPLELTISSELPNCLHIIPYLIHPYLLYYSYQPHKNLLNWQLTSIPPTALLHYTLLQVITNLPHRKVAGSQHEVFCHLVYPVPVCMKLGSPSLV